MGIEFQCDKTKRVLEMEFILLTPLKFIFKNCKDGKFCYIYFYTIKKNGKINPQKKRQHQALARIQRNQITLTLLEM